MCVRQNEGCTFEELYTTIRIYELLECEYLDSLKGVCRVAKNRCHFSNAPNTLAQKEKGNVGRSFFSVYYFLIRCCKSPKFIFYSTQRSFFTLFLSSLSHSLNIYTVDSSHTPPLSRYGKRSAVVLGFFVASTNHGFGVLDGFRCMEDVRQQQQQQQQQQGESPGSNVVQILEQHQKVFLSVPFGFSTPSQTPQTPLPVTRRKKENNALSQEKPLWNPRPKQCNHNDNNDRPPRKLRRLSQTPSATTTTTSTHDQHNPQTTTTTMATGHGSWSYRPLPKPTTHKDPHRTRRHRGHAIQGTPPIHRCFAQPSNPQQSQRS